MRVPARNRLNTSQGRGDWDDRPSDVNLPLATRLPLVAIIGRPNVGKSTLFNRLIGRRQAIVHDRPGVTRDRNFGLAEWRGRTFRIVDTGGFETRLDDPLLESVVEQVQLAIDEADL